MEERRRLRRKALVGSVEIYSKDDKRRLGKGYVTDLNDEGLRLVCSDKFKMGDEFSLHFSLPNGWHPAYFGKVVYMEKAVSAIAYGIRFLPGQNTYIFGLL